MSDTKFSPGPWSRSSDRHDWYITAADGNTIMCDMQYYPFVTSEDADWHLIAAAPSLYEALRRIVERHEEYRNRQATMHEFECCIDSAVELLAKARGEVA